jgi:hypothetical protein
MNPSPFQGSVSVSRRGPATLGRGNVGSSSICWAPGLVATSRQAALLTARCSAWWEPDQAGSRNPNLPLGGSCYQPPQRLAWSTATGLACVQISAGLHTGGILVAAVPRPRSILQLCMRFSIGALAWQMFARLPDSTIAAGQQVESASPCRAHKPAATHLRSATHDDTTTTTSGAG